MSMMKSLIPAVLATVPFAANVQAAPTIDATVTLGYGSSSVDTTPGIDLGTTTLSFSSDVHLSDRFSVGFDGDFAKTSIDVSGVATGLDVNRMRFALQPVYRFDNGFRVGGYYQHGNLDVSISTLPISFGIDLDSYGVLAGYNRGAVDVEAYYGVSKTDPSISGLDLTDYGVAATYQVSPKFDIFGRVAKTDIGTPIGGLNPDLTLYGIGGDYSFDNGMSVFGSVAQISLGGLPAPVGSVSGTQYAIGLSYDVSRGAGNVPVILNAEYAYTNLDGGIIGSTNMSRWGVGVTIPLGANASSKPLNTRGRALTNDYRSLITTGLFAGL